MGDIFVSLPRPCLLKEFDIAMDKSQLCTFGEALYCRQAGTIGHLVPLEPHVKYQSQDGNVSAIIICLFKLLQYIMTL